MRARTRFLLLFAAVAATVLTAFLLLREGGMPGVPERHAVTGGRTVPAEDSGSPPTARREPKPAALPVEDPVTEGPRLDLRAVVGGEWALPGVQVLAVERFRDGALVAMIGDDAPDGGETDAEGRITLRYKTEPAERLFGILPDAAEFESADNAEPVGDIGPFRILRAASAAPVTLRFRDADGTVLLRPVDAATGEALAGREGIRFAWTWPNPGEEPQEDSADAKPASAGWLRSRIEFVEPVSEARLLVPGYLPAPAPEGGWKGRVVLALREDPATVRGRIAVPAGWAVAAVLRGAVDGAECADPALLGLPGRPGPFSLNGVPAGVWDLVVRAWEGNSRGGDVSWVVRRFEFRGSGLDLGELSPRPGVVLRARLTGNDGLPVTDERLALVRALPGRAPVIGYNRWKGGVSIGIAWPGSPDELELTEKQPEDDGWVEFRGLCPGGSYLVATPRVPGLTRIVEMPSKPGEVLTLEMDGVGAKATCVVRFTVEGEDPQFWRGFTGPAFGDQFSTGKGVLEAEIPPGRYRVSALAARGPEANFRMYDGELEIPAIGHFEGTVDLKPRER